MCFPLVSVMPLSASVVHKTKQFGEPRPDKALVYVVRGKAFVGGGVSICVFEEEQLIAFVRNNTYGSRHVDPGPWLPGNARHRAGGGRSR